MGVREEWLEAGRPQRPREERLGTPGPDRECAGSRESQTPVGWEQMVPVSAREDHDAIYEVLGVVAEVRACRQAVDVCMACRQDLTG